MQNDDNRIPYTYLIGWSSHNKWYYGVRFGKNCHPNDLWKTYFSSSKHVKKFREVNGEPDIIEIRKTFNDIKKARLWEEKILKKLDVTNNQNKWINKNAHPAIINDIHPMLGRHLTEKHKNILREKNLGKKMSAETCKKMSLARRGVKKSEAFIQKLRERRLSEEHKQKISLGLLKNDFNARVKYFIKNGEKVEIFNLYKFSRNNNLNYDRMHKVWCGKRKEYEGYVQCLE